MLYCEKCGKQITEKSNYCSGCGKKLVPGVSTISEAKKSTETNSFKWEENLHLILLPFTIALAVLDVFRLITAGVGIYIAIKEYQKEDSTKWTNRKLWIVISVIIHAIYIPAILFS
jgi:uncharacterized membrane protein YvbJ